MADGGAARMPQLKSNPFLPQDMRGILGPPVFRELCYECTRYDTDPC
jgi:hypothetical protein